MPFLHPAILAAGLAAVAVPIIIHLLLRRRKKPMEWGAMRFVLEAYRKTRRRTNLERWLLLACRCLLIAALAVGIARPLVADRAASAHAGGRTVWFILDDGLIGQTTQDGRTDLARAADRARHVLASLGPGDRAGLVLAGAPARAVVSPPSGNLAGLRAALDALTPTDAPSDLPGAIGLAAEAIAADRSAAQDTSREDTLFIAHGLRAGTGHVGEPLTRLPAGVRILAAEPPPRAEPNVAITSSKALRPVFITGGEASEAAQTVTVSLRRYGDGLDKPAATRVSVRLMQADREPQAQRTTGTVNWTPGQREASITLVVDPPRTTASTSADPRRPATGIVIAEIDTADAVAGDNTARLPVISRETLRVGVLADATARGSSLSAGTADRFRPGQWVNLALRPSESAPVDLVELEPGALDAARTAGLDAVVILSPESLAPADAPGPAAANGWTRLKPFVDQGGLLVITPAFEAASQQWSQALSAGLGVSLSVAQAPREFPTDAPGRLSGAAPPDLGPIDALATLRAELEPLARPVAITRLLPPLESPTGSQAGEESRVLLRTTDGAPFVTLLTARPDGGRSGAVIYLSSAFDLRWTDLPAKPLMVPLLQELIRQGVGRARPTFASTAGAKAVAPQRTTELRPLAGNAPPLPVDAAGRTLGPVRSAGAWRAKDAQGADRGMVAVNAPATADTSPIAKERAAAWLAAALPEPSGSPTPPAVEWAADADPSRALSAPGSGKDAARAGAGSMLLAAALALALVELVLARTASTTAQRPPTPGVARA